MQDGRHAELARGCVDLRIEAYRKRKREQLIIRAEVALPQPRDVLRISRGGACAARIGMNRADTGLL